MLIVETAGTHTHTQTYFMGHNNTNRVFIARVQFPHWLVKMFKNVN